MGNEFKYTSTVLNRAGRTVFTPNVGDADDLMQTLPADPYAISSTQLFPLGSKLVEGERCWRYCLNGTGALTAGMILQNAAAVHADQQEDIAVGAAAAIGATSVELTSTADLDGSPNNTANEFAEGYLVVNDAAGEGHCYKIKSNELFTGTEDSTFTLYDGLVVALTTSSQCGLINNPYHKVVVATAVATGMCVGVAQHAVTASYYFWSQTGGPAAVVAHAAIALGTMAVVGTTEGEADPHAAFNTELIIGYPMTPAIADDESFICFLTLDN